MLLVVSYSLSGKTAALASRLARRLPIDPALPIHLGFFAVTYTVIGLNQGSLWQVSGAVAAIARARTALARSAV